MPAEGFPAPPAPQFGTIPDVVGLKAERAQHLLVTANFTPKVETVDSAEPAGTVIAQTPAGGTSAQLGALVTLQVSSGVPAKVKVPDVVGLTEADATVALKASGFVVRVVDEPVSHAGQVGTVLKQDPPAGTKALQGTTVTITVGSAPGSPTPSPSPAGVRRRAWRAPAAARPSRRRGPWPSP